MSAAIIYVFAVLGANLTATHFLPLPLFGQVALGTFIFGLTFTQRDRMHYRGRRFVYTIIFAAAVINLSAMLLYRSYVGLPLVGWLDAHGLTWLSQGSRDLMASSTRIFTASFIAIVLAEAADTEVYHRLRDRSWIVRVLRSNALSIPLDSILFNLIAFAGIFPWSLLISIVFGEIVVKFGVGTVYAFLRPSRESIRATIASG